MSQWLVTGWLSPEHSYFNDLQGMKRIFAKDMPTIVNLKRKHQMTNHGLLNRYQVKNLSKKELELATGIFPPKCLVDFVVWSWIHLANMFTHLIPEASLGKKAASPSFTSQVKLIFACPLRPWNMGIHGPSGKISSRFSVANYRLCPKSNLKIKWK